MVTVPWYPFIGLLIKLDSHGPVFYCRPRVGLNGRLFAILKFRTMVQDAELQRSVTTSGDTRITKVGGWLRRLKIDEFPTFWNVLKGDMSIVGPRPEVAKYVDHYTPEQRRVLSVRPGITDPGTLYFNDEAGLLTDEDQSEDGDIQQILPEKLRLNLEYIDKRSFLFDLRIIVLTIFLIIRQCRS